MSKQMLELLGRCLESNGIEFVIWNQEHSLHIPIEIDHEVFDYLDVVWESEFDDNGLATGEFVYKVTHEDAGTLWKYDSTVDTCEFIRNEIALIVYEQTLDRIDDEFFDECEDDCYCE